MGNIFVSLKNLILCLQEELIDLRRINKTLFSNLFSIVMDLCRLLRVARQVTKIFAVLDPL